MATKVKWLSHSGFMITSSEGKVVFIDPFIEGNPLAPMGVGGITAADVVLVTHDHADHVGSAVGIAMRTGAIVCAAPETAGRLQQEMGLPSENVVFFGSGMGIGATVEIAGLSITMTQAMHSSGTAVAAGYIIRMEDGTTIYHSGDTGIFASMKLFGEMHKIDLALLPIGGVYTMDPVQAAQAVKLINPRQVSPMHYRTWPFLEASADRFVQLTQKSAPNTKVIVLDFGQEHTL